jgi:hypothetical protein
MRMLERRRAPLERRDGRRAPFVAAVRCTPGGPRPLRPDEAPADELALAQNLGPAGIELKLRPGPACTPRTPLALAFALPDGGELVRARGTVVFERSAGDYQTCGVRFTQLSESDHARIVRVLRSL